jgi:alkylation response protein AidB-like acyl-CoA dehydrogenase
VDVDIAGVPAEYAEYRDEVRRFIAAHTPSLKTKRRNGHRTPEFAEDIAALKRWIAALHSAGYQPAGNPDPDPFKRRILREEIAASGLPGLLGNSALLTALERFGTPDQKQRYLPQIYSGQYALCQLFSEPEAGSDLASLKTRAVKDGDVFRVHGTKTWTSWGQWADYGILLARTDGEAEKHSGISAFIISMRQPGVQVRPMRMCVGTSDFSEVVIDGAELPAENLIGAENDGWQIALATLFGERTAIFAGGSDHAAGKANTESGPRATVLELFELASKTSSGGKPLLDQSVWRYRLADLYAQASVQVYNSYRVMTRAAQNTTTPADAPVSKIIGSELNLKLAEAALALLGAESVLVEGDPSAHRDGHWQDWFLYARALMIGGGTLEVMRNIIAERALGLPK